MCVESLEFIVAIEKGCDMWLYVLDILTLACVVRGLGLWLKGSSFRSRTTSRQHWNRYSKMGITEGV